MTRKIVGIIAVIGLLGVLPATQASQLQDDFMGIKWGTHITKLAHFVRTGTNGPVDYYVDPNVVYVIDDVEFREVIFGFYSSRLFAVFIHIDSFESFLQVRSYIQSKYGVPKMVFTGGDFPTTYRWKHQQIKVKMKSDTLKEKMKLVFYYEPLSSRLNDSQKADIEKVGVRLLPMDKGREVKRIPLLSF